MTHQINTDCSAAQCESVLPPVDSR